MPIIDDSDIIWPSAAADRALAPIRAEMLAQMHKAAHEKCRPVFPLSTLYIPCRISLQNEWGQAIKESFEPNCLPPLDETGAFIKSPSEQFYDYTLRENSPYLCGKADLRAIENDINFFGRDNEDVILVEMAAGNCAKLAHMLSLTQKRGYRWPSIIVVNDHSDFYRQEAIRNLTAVGYPRKDIYWLPGDMWHSDTWTKNRVIRRLTRDRDGNFLRYSHNASRRTVYQSLGAYIQDRFDDIPRLLKFFAADTRPDAHFRISFDNTTHGQTLRPMYDAPENRNLYRTGALLACASVGLQLNPHNLTFRNPALQLSRYSVIAPYFYTQESYSVDKTSEVAIRAGVTRFEKITKAGFFEETAATNSGIEKRPLFDFFRETGMRHVRESPYRSKAVPYFRQSIWTFRVDGNIPQHHLPEDITWPPSNFRLPGPSA